MRKTALQRKPMKRRPLRRDWSDALAKVEVEGECRGCRRSKKQLRVIGRTLEAAHTIGRTYDRRSSRPGFDRYVHPAATVPLCGPPPDTGTCHQLFDGHDLDLWSSLRDDEIGWAIERIGSGQARRRIKGRR